MDWCDRTAKLLGDEAVTKLKSSCAVVVGIGGVGSYVFEALVRSSVGKIYVIDKDIVDITNINRQLVASISTVGMDKVDVAKNHALDINPDIEIVAIKEFLDETNIESLLPNDADIIIDAIDSMKSKIELVKFAKKNDIKIYCSMGTANKIDPLMFDFDDISKTSMDPLAKVFRREMKKLGISDVEVVYSKEKPKKLEQDKTELGSVSFVPAAAGLILASKAVDYLVNK